jgi:hypothetical protein
MPVARWFVGKKDTYGKEQCITRCSKERRSGKIAYADLNPLNQKEEHPGPPTTMELGTTYRCEKRKGRCI